MNIITAFQCKVRVCRRSKLLNKDVTQCLPHQEIDLLTQDSDHTCLDIRFEDHMSISS